MPSRFGVALLTCLLFYLACLRSKLQILGANGEILRILDTDYAIGAVEGSQGTYFCYVCPDGTSAPMLGAVSPSCTNNGSVLLTVLREFLSLAFKVVLDLVMYHGV